MRSRQDVATTNFSPEPSNDIISLWISSSFWVTGQIVLLKTACTNICRYILLPSNSCNHKLLILFLVEKVDTIHFTRILLTNASKRIKTLLFIWVIFLRTIFKLLTIVSKTIKSFMKLIDWFWKLNSISFNQPHWHSYGPLFKTIINLCSYMKIV